MNVLALGAHPDDVEFLCAGTLLKYRQQGHNIFIALTTSGNIGSNTHASREEIGAVREAEQLAAAEVLGAKVRFLRFDDELLCDTPESRRAVLDAMRWAEPDVIFTNPPFDTSTDHATTGELVTRVLLSMPARLIPSDERIVEKPVSVFFWDIPAAMGFEPEAFVDISEVFEKKLEALSKHVSQNAWMEQYDTGDTFAEYCTVLARLRGLQSRCRYAEAFRGHRVLGYAADFRLLP